MTDTGELATHPATSSGTPPTGDHELVALVCRLVGDVDYHAARLSRVEERTDSLAGFVDRFEETFTGPRHRHRHRWVRPVPRPHRRSGRHRRPGCGARRRRAADRAGHARAGGLGQGQRRRPARGREIPQTGGAPYWCRRWWLHPEAIARFEATRRCWVEAVAGEGAAMVVYFEHLDAMLAALCGENGPFCGCVGGQHNDTGISAPLGQDDPDKGYYRSFEHPDDTP